MAQHGRMEQGEGPRRRPTHDGASPDRASGARQARAAQARRADAPEAGAQRARHAGAASPQAGSQQGRRAGASHARQVEGSRSAGAPREPRAQRRPDASQAPRAPRRADASQASRAPRSEGAPRQGQAGAASVGAAPSARPAQAPRAQKDSCVSQVAYSEPSRAPRQPGNQQARRPGAPSAQRPVNPSVRPAAPLQGDTLAYARGGQQYSSKKGSGGPWRIVFIVALVVLLTSVGALGYIGFTYWNGQKGYDEITQSNFTPPADAASASLADFNVDWDALRAVNPDVVGWVYVQGTSINYPIVHRDGDDSYYLNHTFNNETTGLFGAEFGCIMLSGENKADFTDQVNIVYGHNMANGSMFAQFAAFTDSATFNEHRTVFILTPQGNFRLKTFSENRIAGTDTTIVIPNFSSKDQLEEYVQKRLDDSLVTPDPAPRAASEMTQVFAFSTCDNADDNYRFITFAEVEEYLPAGASGSLDNSLVDPNAVASVGDSASERANS